MAGMQLDLKQGGLCTNAIERQLFYNYMLQKDVKRKSDIVRVFVTIEENERRVSYMLDIPSFWEGYKQYCAVFGRTIK